MKRKMTKKKLDRALLKMFNIEESVLPRCAMGAQLYDYVWDLWARSSAGRRAIARRG